MRPFRISLVGLDAWEWNFVTATIEIAAGTDVASWVCVSRTERPDAVLLRPPATADAPIIITCVDASVRDMYVGGPVLERPITYTGLIAALRAAEQTLRRPRAPEPVAPPPPSAPIPPLQAAEGAPRTESSSRPDLDETQELTATLAHCARPSRRFRESTRLLGLVQTASLRSTITEIGHPGFPALTIIPAELSYVCAVDPAMVASMFRTPAWAFTARELDPVAAAHALAGMPRRPLWRLLYCAALLGSEARMLADVGPNDTLRLLAEPDFDSVPHYATHRRIAEHMLSHVDTLIGIASATGAHLDAVIDFCNACEQVGLVERNGAQVRGAMLSAHGRRHALASAITRLKGWFR